MPFYTRSIFLAIFACVLWSTAFVGIKLGIEYTTPLQFAGIRFMISGLLILPFCRELNKGFRMAAVHWKGILLISFFQTFLLYSFFYLGISKVSASVTALIIGASPFFIALMARFANKEVFSRRKALAIVFGFSGIAVIAFGRFGGFGKQEISLIGAGILILGNISGGIGNILVSKKRLPVSPMLVNAIQIFTGGAGILVLSFFVEGMSFGYKPPVYYYSLIYLSILSAAAFSIWFVVLSRPHIKVSEINIWKFIIPVFGAVLSWIILPDDKPEMVTILGMALVGVSMVVMNLKKKRS